ncbi:sulfotransferase [Novosphingobium sp. PC22D]|uniref:sulfotransferase family protein n=1 Tax=Novosphingobium sp. PC22D TaxID=1962403 RepID=UPI000BF08795|nr:sulfotransferase [Novosphingobium sp. PC22D]PEQ12622.1 sulfotransferase [Novosphingobium sp. PC22D]
MNSATTLSQRSRLVDAANRALPLCWKTGVLPRPEFDADAICRTMREETGLDDFGDEWFREPLDVLAASLRDEAKLNAVGKFGAIGQIRKVLKERLYAQHWFDAHPEILERSLARPIVVVGPMRSGTTRLHRLLAADDRFAHLRLFETISPAPSPHKFRPRGADRRWLAASAIVGMVHRFNPNTARIHPTAPFEPEEELGLLVASMWGMKHEAQWNVPSYGRWAEEQDATPAYEHLARLLKLAGWLRGEDDSRPWVLKTPQHMLDLPALLKVFPDARIVFTHRQPEAVVGSSCSLVWNQMIIHSDQVEAERIGREWLRKTDLQIERMRAARKRIARSQRIDVRYEDVERDWLGVMRRIYAFLDLDIEPALPAMSDYVTRARRSLIRRPHRYDLASFGIDEERVSERFASYAEAFALGEDSPAPTSPILLPVADREEPTVPPGILSEPARIAAASRR